MQHHCHSIFSNQHSWLTPKQLTRRKQATVASFIPSFACMKSTNLPNTILIPSFITLITFPSQTQSFPSQRSLYHLISKRRWNLQSRNSQRRQCRWHVCTPGINLITRAYTTDDRTIESKCCPVLSFRRSAARIEE